MKYLKCDTCSKRSARSTDYPLAGGVKCRKCMCAELGLNLSQLLNAMEASAAKAAARHSHAACYAAGKHPKTKAGRAACRRDRRIATVAGDALEAAGLGN